MSYKSNLLILFV